MTTPTSPTRNSAPPPDKISRQVHRLLDASVAIQEQPDSEIIAYLSRQLVQCTLPHRNPGDVPAYQKKNGALTMTILPGWNAEAGRSYGFPYGTIPRLLLFWLTTEVVRCQSRHVELGETLAGFMRKLGLDPAHGGARSDATRLRDQMQRLFRSTISFQQHQTEGALQKHRWLDMQIAPEGELWWDMRSPGQSALFSSWIDLGERFYEAILAHPVPVDLRALNALKQSPLALDLYAWASYRTYRATVRNKVEFIPWRSLKEQFGGDYANAKDFKRKAKLALRKVYLVYPHLRAEEVRGGIELSPARSAIRPIG